MKTNLILVLAVMTVFIASCGKKNLPDPVLGVPPIHQWNESTLAIVDSISSAAHAQPEQARQMIASTNLGQRILDYLNLKGAKIEYFVVNSSSKDTVKVLDKNDKVLSGFLTKDQLIVRITPKGGKAKVYFVRCMNGIVSPIDGSSFIGEEIYILSEGEGPMHYGATYAQVWNMTERYRLNLTAYRIDKKGHKHRVRNARTLDDFKKLSEKYGLVRINTIHPGDRLRKSFDGSWDYLGN